MSGGFKAKGKGGTVMTVAVFQKQQRLSQVLPAHLCLTYWRAVLILGLGMLPGGQRTGRGWTGKVQQERVGENWWYNLSATSNIQALLLQQLAVTL